MSTTAADQPELTINVVSDVVCPWCFIGKRRLEAAIDLYKQRFPNRPEPVVTWWPFQLNPDMPAEGVDRAEHMAKKFGKAQLEQAHQRLAGIGNEVGIPFDFEATKRQPNTLAAHSLIELAAGHRRARRSARRDGGNRAGQCRHARSCCCTGQAGARARRHRRAVLHFQ
jgi:predicted DsbA family dithiol-disulfide isomerase